MHNPSGTGTIFDIVNHMVNEQGLHPHGMAQFHVVRRLIDEMNFLCEEGVDERNRITAERNKTT